LSVLSGHPTSGNWLSLDFLIENQTNRLAGECVSRLSPLSIFLLSGFSSYRKDGTESATVDGLE
jgi:hypothetical protein